MTDNSPKTDIISYQIKVGHMTLKVSARTKEEAIQEARRRLRSELPRMWDVITRMDNTRFEVCLEP